MRQALVVGGGGKQEKGGEKNMGSCIKPGNNWTICFYDIDISDYKIDIQINGNSVYKYICLL
jgi:hypothetical protein